MNYSVTYYPVTSFLAVTIKIDAFILKQVCFHVLLDSTSKAMVEFVFIPLDQVIAYGLKAAAFSKALPD